jgi:hypothetical protein
VIGGVAVHKTAGTLLDDDHHVLMTHMHALDATKDF